MSSSSPWLVGGRLEERAARAVAAATALGEGGVGDATVVECGVVKLGGSEAGRSGLAMDARYARRRGVLRGQADVEAGRKER